MSQYAALAANGAFDYSSTYANGSIGYKLKSDLPSILDYWHIGIDPTGSTSSQAGFAYVLANLKGCYKLPKGRYLITGLQWPSDICMIGENSDAYFWEYYVNPPAIGSCTELYYTGAGGTNSAIINFSRVAVGTLPVVQPDESQTVRNAGLWNVVLNGGAGLVEFGFYSARAGLGSSIGNLTVTNTKLFGFWIGECYSAKFGPLIPIHNLGTGIAVGYDYFGWSTQNITNALQFDIIYAYKNGRDATYDYTTNPLHGVGAILNPNRTVRFQNLTVEMNYGVGAYISPRAGPNTFSEVYCEDNCYFDPAADGASYTNSAYPLGKVPKPFGIVGYNRKVSGDTVEVFIDKLFGAAPGSPNRYQDVKLTGDTSGGFVQEPDEPWIIRGVFGINDIDSDFYKYVIEYGNSSLIGASGNISRCLPSVGSRPEVLTTSRTTLYCGNTQSGDKSGSSAGNLMLLSDAIECARICKGIVTIDVSAMTSTSATGATLDGWGYTRRVTIEGGTTGRFNISGQYAATIQNWATKLTIQNMAVLDRLNIKDCADVDLNNDPLIRMGPSGDTTVGGAVWADNSKVEVNGTSVINVSASSAATKTGISLQANSQVSFNNAAAGTIVSFTAGHAIEFNEGSGIVRISLTTATATWGAAASVTRNANGGAGMVMAPNGLNP
jgi:hypothetical protein